MGAKPSTEKKCDFYSTSSIDSNAHENIMRAQRLYFVSFRHRDYKNIQYN